ncbi:MAG: hypothetical protein GY801_45320 [bacterium]|nr:hypothetical protein [bacterium]
MPKLASKFETEELIAELLEWWFDNEDEYPETPRFVEIAQTLARRLPGTEPCKRGNK